LSYGRKINYPVVPFLYICIGNGIPQKLKALAGSYGRKNFIILPYSKDKSTWF